jgi:replicative DNA helicase
MPTIASSQAHLLPQDNDSERAVLGALLIDPDAVLKVREVALEPRDFYQEMHGLIYKAMLDLADRWQPVDAVTLAAALDSRQNGHGSQLALIGGPAYLADLIGATPTSVYAAHYAGVVKALAQRRRLISTAASIAEAAQAHEGPMDALYNTVSGLFYGAVDVAGPRSHLYGTDDTLADYLTTQAQRAELLKRNPNALAQTGIPDLDRILGNLESGTVIAIAARPGVGKTILMEQIADHNARQGKRVAFYHLELSHQFMLDRRMAHYSGVPLDQLRRGQAGQDDPHGADRRP